MNANETQVGGTHYKSALEHWDWSALLRLPAMDHQISRYVSRHHKKNGAQDLQKALHHVKKLTEQVEAGVLSEFCVGNSTTTLQRDVARAAVSKTADFVAANECPAWVHGFLMGLLFRTSVSDLNVLAKILEDVIAGMPPEPKDTPLVKGMFPTRAAVRVLGDYPTSERAVFVAGAQFAVKYLGARFLDNANLVEGDKMYPVDAADPTPAYVNQD